MTLRGGEGGKLLIQMRELPLIVFSSSSSFEGEVNIYGWFPRTRGLPSSIHFSHRNLGTTLFLFLEKVCSSSSSVIEEGTLKLVWG